MKRFFIIFLVLDMVASTCLLVGYGYCQKKNSQSAEIEYLGGRKNLELVCGGVPAGAKSIGLSQGDDETAPTVFVAWSADFSCIAWSSDQPQPGNSAHIFFLKKDMSVKGLRKPVNQIEKVKILTHLEWAEKMLLNHKTGQGGPKTPKEVLAVVTVIREFIQ